MVLVCLCFQDLFVSAIVHILHNARSPNQATDCSSKLHLLFLPSRHLLFPQWRPQDNHTFPGCHNWNRSQQIWDKSLPVFRFAKIYWQNFYIFSRLIFQVAADKKSSAEYGVNKKKENPEDYFSGKKKCYFASGACGIIGLAPNIPILPIIYAPLAPTTQILVFLSHTFDPFHLSQPI